MKQSPLFSEHIARKVVDFLAVRCSHMTISKFWSITEAAESWILGTLIKSKQLALLPPFLHLHLEHGYETVLFKLTSLSVPILCFYFSLSTTLDTDDTSP